MPSSKVPSVNFDTAALPEDQRFRRWSGAIANYDVSLPHGADPAAFVAKADAWTLSDVVVASSRLSPVRFVRSAEKVAADRVDDFSFLLVKEGAWRGDAGGRALTVGAGRLAVLDLIQPVELEGTGGETITVQVRRSAVQARLPRVPSVHGRVLDDPMGRLLAEHFAALVRQLPHVEQSEAGTLAHATIGLVASCFSALPARPNGAIADMTTHIRIKNYIDENLTVRDLSPERICRDLALSRPALYRAFANGVGIAAYIRAQRLAAVHDLLANAEEGRAIAALAYCYGFASEAHFSKVFRKRYGYSPSELRTHKAASFRRLAVAVETKPVAEGFATWVKEMRK